MNRKLQVGFIVVTAFLLIASYPLAVYAITLTQLYTGPAPIRSITKIQNGDLVGGRSAGNWIEVWASSDNGVSWHYRGTVAYNPNIEFGDPMFMAVPGTNTIYVAFRERNSQNRYWITVCKSTDGGVTWTFDSNVESNVPRFVGAPYLFIANNGDMQIYYDSEQAPVNHGVNNGSQWIVMKGRNGLGGPWTKYGTKVVARAPNINHFVREGMPSVIDLGNNRIMVVTEGVEHTPSGGSYANVIRSIQSFDGGVTWNYSLHRQTVYQSPVDPGSGRRFNAYAPMGIRIGGGPVGVVFVTDEDFSGPPDYSHTPPELRRAHVKYIRTTNTFENWSSPEPIWTGGSQAYAPGMVERAWNDVLITIDHFYGNQRIIHMDPW